jgi:CheY-like chemotaxis protein
VTSPAASAPVLVVDDDRDIRDSIREILIDEGYAVACAADGQEALDYLERHAKVGVILLDLMMPGMDGFQFREEQAADPRLARIPVVLMSADSGVMKRRRLPGNEFLRKPIDIDCLVDAVKRNWEG